MSSLHTQGKWLVEEETCVVNEEGYAIADCNLGFSSINELQEQKANARRIVACVNACNRLSIPVLQQAVFTDMTVDYVLKCAEAKKQNAELLAVMEKAAKHIEENGLVSNCKYASGWLREAIAKAGAL